MNTRTRLRAGLAGAMALGLLVPPLSISAQAPASDKKPTPDHPNKLASYIQRTKYKAQSTKLYE